MDSIGRTKLHLATVYVRDATLRQAFETQHQAMQWVVDQRQSRVVVQWSIEEVWLIPAR